MGRAVEAMTHAKVNFSCDRRPLGSVSVLGQAEAVAIGAHGEAAPAHPDVVPESCGTTPGLLPVL